MLFLSVIDDPVKRDQLEQLYRRYSKDMWFVANDILGDAYEAEDVVQTAFIKLAQYLDKDLDLNCNKTKGLIVIIVRNLSINIYRSRQKKPTVSVDGLEDVLAEGEEGLPEMRIIRLDQVKEVAGKLEKIKTEYADILSMKYSYEYTNEEIASVLETTQGNVRIKLMRAKKALHEIMEEDNYEL